MTLRFSGITRIALTLTELDLNHTRLARSGASSSDLDGMEIDVAGQTVIMLIALWLSLQVPLGLATARALVRANRRN
jgi:hypothetical protein